MIREQRQPRNCYLIHCTEASSSTACVYHSTKIYYKGAWQDGIYALHICSLSLYVAASQTNAMYVVSPMLLVSKPERPSLALSLGPRRSRYTIVGHRGEKHEEERKKETNVPIIFTIALFMPGSFAVVVFVVPQLIFFSS